MLSVAHDDELRRSICYLLIRAHYSVNWLRCSATVAVDDAFKDGRRRATVVGKFKKLQTHTHTYTGKCL